MSNTNHPQKGSTIKVEPIRSLDDIKAIKKLLANSPRDYLLFTMGPLAEVNNQRYRYLTEGELKRLSKAVKESENPMLAPIISMLILTGARRGEVLNARWEDIDLSRKRWRIPYTKSGKPRTVPLSESALEVLNNVPRVEGSPFVFPNPKTGKPFNSIYRSWNTARKKAGLEDVVIHSLRHSLASFLINSGRNLYEVGALLGHTQVKTTMRYAHLADETLQEAVNSVPIGEGSLG